MRRILRFLAIALLAGACTTGGGSEPTPPDGPVPSGDGGLIPFMEACTLGIDEQCDTGLCFDFNTKGPHCTHACAVDTDCAAPSPGCNGMGVCKAPGGGTGDGTGGG